MTGHDRPESLVTMDRNTQGFIDVANAGPFWHPFEQDIEAILE
jgi:hypothetical protein